MLLTFTTAKTGCQRKGILYVDEKDIISIYAADEDNKTCGIYLRNGNAWTVNGNVNDIKKKVFNE